MKHITANSRKQLILETLKKTGEIKIAEFAGKFGKLQITITLDLD